MTPRTGSRRDLCAPLLVALLLADPLASCGEHLCDGFRTAPHAFDCLLPPDQPIRLDPQDRPDACDASVWCVCASTLLARFDEGLRSAICQRQFYYRSETLFGLQTLLVDGGTLDLDAVRDQDLLGRFVIEMDVPVGAAELREFRISFAMNATGGVVRLGCARAILDFEIRAVTVNDVALGVLGYNPTDAFHSDGLVYAGTVIAEGPDQGFTLFYELIPEPRDAVRGIEDEDLIAHDFNIPLAMELFGPDSEARFLLPASGGSLTADVTLEQISDPFVFQQFVDTIEVEPRDGSSPTANEFRRGDANGDGSLDLADAVFTLAYLFTGGPASDCPDAADSDDNGRIELADPIAALGTLFLGRASLPEPVDCGCDLTTDELLGCSSSPCDPTGEE